MAASSPENIFVTPSSSTTSSRARPNTGDGFASGSRSVAMMSSRNGSTAEHAGRSAARFPGAPGILRAGWLEGVRFEFAHEPDADGDEENRKRAEQEKGRGRPVRSAGILKISAPVAASVSSSTASTGSSEAVITARPMASTSTSSTNGQTMKREFRKFENRHEHQHQRQRRKNLAPPHVVVMPRRRCSNAGKTE
jgi:hypothetical protein